MFCLCIFYNNDIYPRARVVIALDRRRFPRRDGQRAKHVEVTTTQNIVVPYLALVGSCFAIAIPDPVLPLPLVWGVVLQKGFPRSIFLWLAIGILLGGSAVSILRTFLWEF